MSSKLIISLSVAIILASCSPQVRFSSGNFSKTLYTSISKKSDKDSKSKTKVNSSFLEKSINIESLDNLDNRRVEILKFAENWLGTPYCYGGEDKECTDCSGFVKQVFSFAGINLPRTAALQYTFGKEIGDSEMVPGDLVFFIRQNKIGHVGIYVGNNEFIHASTNNGVILTSLEDKNYRETFAGFRRVI